MGGARGGRLPVPLGKMSSQTSRTSKKQIITKFFLNPKKITEKSTKENLDIFNA